MRIIVAAFSAIVPMLCGGIATAADAPVATTVNLQFHSAFWINLHHTLYASAWAKRPKSQFKAAGMLAGAPLSEQERAVWDAAVDYYDRNVADRDLRGGQGMTQIKRALAAEDLADDAISAQLRAVLERAAPVYRRHLWPGHDRDNHAWIRTTTGLLRQIEREVVAHHERLYGRPWFSSPVRVDVVWLGRAYTTLNPTTHATVSPTEGSGLTGWTGVEMVLHEVAHELILPTERALASALGDQLGEHGGLWHVFQFYVTGSALRQVLRATGIDYTPYLYSTGLFDRAWSRYRKGLEEHLEPFVRGETTRAEAIERTVRAILGQ